MRREWIMKAPITKKMLFCFSICVFVCLFFQACGRGWGRRHLLDSSQLRQKPALTHSHRTRWNTQTTGGAAGSSDLFAAAPVWLSCSSMSIIVAELLKTFKKHKNLPSIQAKNTHLTCFVLIVFVVKQTFKTLWSELKLWGNKSNDFMSETSWCCRVIKQC